MEKTKIIKVKRAGEIRKKEVVPFTRQLASMLSAGMTILASIQTLEEQTTNKNFKVVLDTLRATIEGGAPMSEGLAHFPSVFDDMYGEFAPVLKRLATILESSSRLKKKVKSAMTYPTVIISIALLMAGGLIQFVVPIFAEMFAGFGKKLPALTQTLVDLSAFVKSWWYIITPIVVVAIFLFRKWKKTKRGQYKFDEFMLRLPIFGQLNQKAAIARFCRLLSQMLASGVPILDALAVA